MIRRSSVRRSIGGSEPRDASGGPGDADRQLVAAVAETELAPFACTSTAGRARKLRRGRCASDRSLRIGPSTGSPPRDWRGAGAGLFWSQRGAATQHPQPDWPQTLDEFRAWHERQPDVWEFIHGVPKLMAPGSKTHTILKSRIARQLGDGLAARGCEVLVDGAVVEVEGSSLIPDVVVTCEPLDFTTPRVAEPVIIVQVPSPFRRCATT